MVRRPLPAPPGSNVSSLPKSKHTDLPPEPLYDDGAEPPPAVGPRGAKPLPHMPGPAQNRVSDGETYESVDIKDEKVVMQPFYDDFDSDASSGEDQQETYDDFGLGGAAPKQPPVDSGDQLYDEMSEGQPVRTARLPPPPLNPGKRLPPPPAGNVGKVPPLTGRRALPPPPSPSEENEGKFDDDNQELYDEMEEGQSVRTAKFSPPPPITGRGLPPPPPARDAGAPPLPTGRQALPILQEPSVYEESEKRSESPGNYYDPDEMQDQKEGWLHQDSNEESSTMMQGHWSIPSAPSLPRRLPAQPVQDEYEEDLPPPPADFFVPSTSRPALPDKPTTSKTLLTQKIDGFDPSQILKVKLKKVERNTPNKGAQKSEELKNDFRAVLHKTPQSKESCPPVQPLQPPTLKKKNVTPNEEKTVNTEEVKAFSKPKPPIQPREEKTEKSVVVPKKVLVSPPPVNMSSHPPPQKISTLPPPPEPKVAETPPPVKTAMVRPERKLPKPPAEDSDHFVEPPDPLDMYPWYHGMIERDETRNRLNSEPGDGVFLVRKSRKGSDTQPYTLVILYEEHFFNLKIRCRPEDQKIALGEEKRGEMAFSSVPSLISYHRDHNVILIGNPGGETKLIKYPKRPY
ncbi:bromodomain-containing protein 4-like isoform X2 [Liolophura sinensis]|uniref:bromodomain-containing protein 4-like isoform X2 n=1 Tax=Liolophura sinensis TaxID=3198878 RepID=UPI00315948D7